MEELNLQALSRAASDKLGEPIEFVSVEKIGSGYHATGYKLTVSDGRHFFIKKIVVNNIGFEYPERKLSALLLSHNMGTRVGLAPRSIGVLLEANGRAVAMPEVPAETHFYHLQEFESGGKSYFSVLEGRANKSEIDTQDRVETDNILSIIASIHAVKPDLTDPARLEAMYMDGLRAELVHPELTLTFLHQMDETHPVLPPSKQADFIALYLDLIHAWKGRVERLRALHGDLWGANMLVRDDGSAWAVDFSRIPWGDPGIDIGRWMGQYVWFYLITGNEYYRDLGELFLDTYVSKTGDTEIRKALTIGYIFPAFIYAGAYDHVDLGVRKRMFEHGCEILKRGEFFWPKL